VKAVGRNDAEFEVTVLRIVRRHVPDLATDAVSARLSGRGRFTAITVTVEATSQEQLDALYRELGEEPSVLMTL
jgi:putative lipoic acid-binding regulatory protein